PDQVGGLVGIGMLYRPDAGVARRPRRRAADRTGQRPHQRRFSMPVDGTPPQRYTLHSSAPERWLRTLPAYSTSRILSWSHFGTVSCRSDRETVTGGQRWR